MSPDTQVLTLMEVAALLRVPKSTVYKLAQNGTVPAFKVGKLLLVGVGELGCGDALGDDTG